MQHDSPHPLTVYQAADPLAQVQKRLGGKLDTDNAYEYQSN
jgi:hypothetical protein